MADDVHVAMIRGINVGGKNRVQMTELADAFREAGADDVRTYIQSGNVVFRAAASAVDEMAERVCVGLENNLGVRIPVVTRSAGEMLRVVSDNPFLAAGADPKALHVAFLSEEPSEADVAKLDPNRSAPDEFRVIGRDVYLNCPNGMARTKLTNDYFDRTVGAVSTMRNWRTVIRLAEMASA